MKRIGTSRSNWSGGAATHLSSRDARRGLIAQVKDAVLADYADLTGEHTRVLRLALNEAEALAWQTGFPHLFFPALATEKARTALSWHRRQRALRARGTEVAFAE
jgi:hypothetical protein